MCLTYSKKITDTAKKSTKEEFIYYKIFGIKNKNLCSPYTENEWGSIDSTTPTIIISNRRNNRLLEKETKEKSVFKGIHVFSTWRGAKFYESRIASNYTSFVTLPVICKKKDLVAAGMFGDRASLVFTKVEIKK